MLGRTLFRFALFAAVLIALGGCASTSNRGYDNPDVVYDDDSGDYPADYASDYDYFNELSDYGTWIQVSNYGWAWCPLDTPTGWRPYTVGYWVWSDDGWLWISEDPWGGTPYHYGRWAYDREYGWVWVPGDVWAPAWVAWRYGDGYVGWAALPPNVGWRPGVGLDYSDYELDQRINRHRWCFTEASQFAETRVRVTVEPTSKNVTLIPRTRNVTKYVPGPTPIDRGLMPETIVEARGRRFDRYQVVGSPTAVGGRTGASVDPGTKVVRVYRPPGKVSEVVKARVRNVPATQRPAPPRRGVERVRQEKAKLEETVQKQREDLNREHQQEMRNRPPGASVQDLKRRQDAEMRAQREEEARQKAELESRERAVTRARERVNERRGLGRGRGQSDDQPNANEAQPDSVERPRGRGRGR